MWQWVKIRTLSEHPNPQNRLKWVVRLPKWYPQHVSHNHREMKVGKGYPAALIPWSLTKGPFKRKMVFQDPLSGSMLMLRIFAIHFFDLVLGTHQFNTSF